MPLDFSRARQLLHSGDLRRLFVEELGWEPGRQEFPIRVGETDYRFAAIAEKRGFTVWRCESPGGMLPGHSTRLQLDRQLSECSFEHLIIFVDGNQTRQSWMWVRRQPGKPVAARTHEYYRGQPGDSLLQKLQVLYVSLEEEEAGLPTVVIAGRARTAFDVERVTKAFYRDFDTHRKAFLKFIDGIDAVADREWYASVMLNRLMFVYFIQRKGFLDGDPDYLVNRLRRCQKEKGKDKFYSFYRYFLLRLFHEGLGTRRKDRAADLEGLLGHIPYLNGGLFDVHELERPDKYGKTIQITDKAFERIFAYFDRYQWHLDERQLRADNEINPDVLGYIFEKYINQKQMGAYYTKEDITEYIAKNAVLPFLFDAAAHECSVAFSNPSGPTVFDHLRDTPDRYIYESVRKGADAPLPLNVGAGLQDVTKRTQWNRPAEVDLALPAETWRDVVARRRVYETLKQSLVSGEVRDVNTLISLNLDIRQFAQDVIHRCEGPDLLRALWHAVERITVLDPTCGSGAFLFAALNILEPLYEACLDRMESFLEDEAAKQDRSRLSLTAHGVPLLPHGKFEDFSLLLDRVEAHPNRRYFVFKSIILNNLFGVDIMKEAVEICKLRLFLKLAAQVEPSTSQENLGIEPLPDIDFNIRVGNSLVGYSTYAEVQQAVTSKMDFDDTMERIAAKAADLQKAFASFRRVQTEADGPAPEVVKSELRERLKVLEAELNRHLAGEYGVKVKEKVSYEKWDKSYQPFHWFLQFHDILSNGGFDVIIGNPPYVEYKDVKDSYTVNGFQTLECGDLYAFTMERSYRLLREGGRLGLIVPVSVFCVDGFRTLQVLSLQKLDSVWASSYSNRPSQLFDGAQKRLTIVIGKRGGSEEPAVHTTSYYRWQKEEFPHLFRARVRYAPLHSNFSVFPSSLEKLGSALEVSAFSKLAGFRERLGAAVVSTGRHRVYYTRKFGYFLAFLDFVPRVTEMRTRRRVNPTELKDLAFPDKEATLIVVAVLSSSTFFWFWNVLSDCRNLNRRDLLSFPFNPYALPAQRRGQLAELGKRYLAALKGTSREMQKSGLMLQTFEYASTKHIIDEIDKVLAEHYGFTPDELDFIVNYDIKYRMGADAVDEDE